MIFNCTNSKFLINSDWCVIWILANVLSSEWPREYSLFPVSFFYDVFFDRLFKGEDVRLQPHKNYIKTDTTLLYLKFSASKLMSKFIRLSACIKIHVIIHKFIFSKTKVLYLRRPNIRWSHRHLITNACLNLDIHPCSLLKSCNLTSSFVNSRSKHASLNILAEKR